jgi:FkbM family methyltransferase
MSLPVVKRLYPSLLKRWARLTWTGGHKVKRYEGLLWLLDWRNYVDRQVGLLGGYEKAQVAYLLSRMKPECDAFIDVGANFGLYALQVAKAGYAREIHAFEPDPRNIGQLTGNLYLNNMAGAVTVHTLAVSDRPGRLSFHLASGTSTGQNRVAAGGNTIVEATTLDAMFRWTGKSVFIKMDIEGHEAAALRGASSLLRDNNCFLQIESYEGQRIEVEGLLRELGYEAVHAIGDDRYFARKSAT